MADRNLREKERFDYKEYSSSGRKVPLPSEDLPEEMSVAADAKTAGKLAGLLFQIEETLGEVVDVSGLDLQELRANHDELKQLRISIVQVSSELQALRNGDVLENADDIKEKLRGAKTAMNNLKDAMAKRVDEEDQTKIGQQVAQSGARKFVFDTVLREIVAIVANLNEKYDIHDDEGISIAKILKRKEMKEKYAAEHDRLRTLIDRLLDFTDVLFDGKELIINAQLMKIQQIDVMREEFEDKLRIDLDLYDLTDQKMKLATHTTIDIGKFSGEVGEDFYTFKTQF